MFAAPGCLPRYLETGLWPGEEAAVLIRIDHVGIACHDIEEAVARYESLFELSVVSREVNEDQGVREAMLHVSDVPGGSSWIQLLEPLDPDGEFARGLEYGLHHICFGVDDVPAATRELAEPGALETTIVGGRGRVSAFVPGLNPLGLRIECTEFRRDEDVEQNPGALV